MTAPNAPPPATTASPGVSLVLLGFVTVLALFNTVMAMVTVTRFTHAELRRDSSMTAFEHRFADSLHASEIRSEQRNPPWFRIACDSTALARAASRGRSSDSAMLEWCARQRRAAR